MTKSSTDNIEGETALQRAQRKYEREKRGADALRIKLTPSDNVDEWNNLKDHLVHDFGSVKEGIYRIGKEKGYLKKLKKQ